MKTAENSLKTYLKYTHQVLGVSHIFSSANNSADSVTVDASKKKISNFYFWPEGRIFREFAFENPAKSSQAIKTLFVFFSEQSDFETQIKDQSELLSKMHQALKGTDQELAIGWLSPNAERDFFQNLARWTLPLKVVFFRTESIAKEPMYTSGPHKILETLTPMENPNDQARKRHIWNDFKQWMAAL